jgi:hypothetical protein
VLLTGDSDFSSKIKQLRVRGFKVIMIHMGKINPALTGLVTSQAGTWGTLIQRCGGTLPNHNAAATAGAGGPRGRLPTPSGTARGVRAMSRQQGLLPMAATVAGSPPVAAAAGSPPMVAAAASPPVAAAAGSPLGAAAAGSPLGAAADGSPLGAAAAGSPLGVAAAGLPLGAAAAGSPLGAAATGSPLGVATRPLVGGLTADPAVLHREKITVPKSIYLRKCVRVVVHCTKDVFEYSFRDLCAR